jgi:hypothetical protein
VDGTRPEDVVAFMLSDETGRRLVEGKDPRRSEGGYRSHPRDAATARDPDGVVLGTAYWLVTARRRTEQGGTPPAHSARVRHIAWHLSSDCNSYRA